MRHPLLEKEHPGFVSPYWAALDFGIRALCLVALILYSAAGILGFFGAWYVILSEIVKCLM